MVLVISLISCHKENIDDCFTSNGPDATVTRTPGGFRALYVENKIDVTVVQGPEYKVEVTAPRNLLRSIETSITGGTLHIENHNTCNFVRGYKRSIKIRVTTPRIEYCENQGVGPLTIDKNFNQDTIVVRAESSGDIHINGTFKQIRTSSHGNGDMYLKAKCNSLYVFSYGTNYTYADEVQVRDYVFLHTLSIGDCYLNAHGLQQLDYNIQSDGNIFYYGKPPIVNDFSSSTAKGRAEERE
jgi:hypothetical protein